VAYSVKTIFGPTLQGEGSNAGRACVFLRLSGCNAWDGRPETRAASACPYCDTEFRGGERLALDAILVRLLRLIPEGADAAQFGCVLTGGEPLLQADQELLTTLGAAFAWVDVETNGTRPCPPRPANVRVSCSPKAITGQPVVAEPDWWKILIPDQEPFLERALASGAPVYLQPTCPDGGPEGATYQANVERCLELCYARGCRLSVQVHKYLGLE
jgi:7-carboxy-7-deazaguanine synthase